MKLRRRRKKKDSATHRYVGPTNIYGLTNGARCILLPRRGPCGMVTIFAQGRTWNVTRSQIEAL